MYKTVTTENFNSEVIESQGPVLLACLLPGYGFEDQLLILEKTLTWHHPQVKACLVAQNCSRALGARFGISGTPYFLLFENGKQKGRWLGNIDDTRLEFFISHCLVNSPANGILEEQDGDNTKETN